MSDVSGASDVGDVSAVLRQCLAGGSVDYHSAAFRQVEAIVADNALLFHELNATHHTLDDIRRLLERITLRSIDPTVSVATPLRCDFGRHIFFGANVFVNTDCLLVDLGGIYLADNVQLGPRVTILTVNHQLDAARRRSIRTASVHIERNAWIGAGATILPGVTVGENAVVGAGSMVTRDVPANVIVVGVPAKVKKSIPSSSAPLVLSPTDKHGSGAREEEAESQEHAGAPVPVPTVITQNTTNIGIGTQSVTFAESAPQPAEMSEASNAQFLQQMEQIQSLMTRQLQMQQQLDALQKMAAAAAPRY